MSPLYGVNGAQGAAAPRKDPADRCWLFRCAFPSGFSRSLRSDGAPSGASSGSCIWLGNTFFLSLPSRPLLPFSFTPAALGSHLQQRITTSALASDSAFQGPQAKRGTEGHTSRGLPYSTDQQSLLCLFCALEFHIRFHLHKVFYLPTY